MPPIKTQRLLISRLTEKDSVFILQLLNQEDFIRFIGDRKVRNLDDAVQYIRSGPMQSYEQHGFGLLKVTMADSGEDAGLCGLLQRDYLDAPDIGFAFLSDYQGLGLAFESSQAVMAYAKEHMHIERIVATTAMKNPKSAALLEKLGLHFSHTATLPGMDQPSRLFEMESS